MEELVVDVESFRGGTGPSRAPHIGFVNLNGETAPKIGAAYDVVPASALPLQDLAVPETPRTFFDLDLHAFYSGNLPDGLIGSNEGLLRIQVDTRAPQDLSNEVTASFVTKFRVRDDEYAPSFASRGVFRNVLFENFVNLRLGLIELDSDLSVYFDKVKKVIDDSGLAQVDVLKGIPYLDVGTKLVNSLVQNFGKNADDVLWSELPILQLHPLIGSVFLRAGIYAVIDRSSEQQGFPGKLSYLNGELRDEHGPLLTTHLIFSVGLRPSE
ncbi:hypothetical protein EKO23_01820 [Nocardioides guangzhouensis]|uniref:Uncharacterized protein n=1 Tax=Nocardioides guangzhouensis TaxID=2497878 RepID=A0A4Q4ZJX4_9ACTN|nr:hypothetical protein [Nocardioides guangzhouensis]RYP88652.1 hypothetical protein EKO23_01820 [Nocardioides guangzhouensis]